MPAKKVNNSVRLRGLEKHIHWTKNVEVQEMDT